LEESRGSPFNVSARNKNAVPVSASPYIANRGILPETEAAVKTAHVCPSDHARRVMIPSFSHTLGRTKATKMTVDQEGNIPRESYPWGDNCSCGQERKDAPCSLRSSSRLAPSLLSHVSRAWSMKSCGVTLINPNDKSTRDWTSTIRTTSHHQRLLT
jgi:hypothetical protein